MTDVRLLVVLLSFSVDISLQKKIKENAAYSLCAPNIRNVHPKM